MSFLGELIRIVSAYIQSGNLTIEDKQTLQERCRAKIEKQRKAPLPVPPPSSRSLERTPTKNEQEERQPNDEAVENVENEPKSFELSPIDNSTAAKASMENDEESQLQIDESHEEEEISFSKTVLENPDNGNSNHSARESGEMRSESGDDMDISDDESKVVYTVREIFKMIYNF